MSSAKKKPFKSFLKDPVNVLILTLAISLVVAFTSGNVFQAALISSIGVVYIIAGILYSMREAQKLLYETLPGLIKYHKIIKDVEITSKDGDAIIGFVYEGENLSDSALEDIFHMLPDYDSDQFPIVVDGHVDGQSTSVEIESMLKQPQGQVGIQKYESKFYFKFPTAVPPGSKLPIHGFKVKITKCYPKAFSNFASTTHAVDVSTDELKVRLTTQGSIKINDWRVIVNDFHGHEDTEELKRIKKECLPHRDSQGKRLVWDIRKPRLTDRYVLKFKLGS
jgi:hypothetical protein